MLCNSLLHGSALLCRSVFVQRLLQRSLLSDSLCLLVYSPSLGACISCVPPLEQLFPFGFQYSFGVDLTIWSTSWVSTVKFATCTSMIWNRHWAFKTSSLDGLAAADSHIPHEQKPKRHTQFDSPTINYKQNASTASCNACGRGSMESATKTCLDENWEITEERVMHAPASCTTPHRRRERGGGKLREDGTPSPDA